jgi:hypothetical protein
MKNKNFFKKHKAIPVVAIKHNCNRYNREGGWLGGLAVVTAFTWTWINYCHPVSVPTFPFPPKQHHVSICESVPYSWMMIFALMLFVPKRSWPGAATNPLVKIDVVNGATCGW